MQLETVLTIGGSTVLSGGAVGSLLLWALRTWETRLNERLDKQEQTLQGVLIQIAENKGKQAGQKELIWREINTDKHKIAELQASHRRIWELLSKVHQRPSDTIAKILEESLKK